MHHAFEATPGGVQPGGRDVAQDVRRSRITKLVPTYVKEHMEEMEGYNYLQMALYQRELCTRGQELYFVQDWEKMVEKFEAALREFYGTLEECRLRCDGPLRYTRFLNFAQAMSKQFMAVKECHTHCIEKLGRFRDYRREDFFSSIFRFLQFGYC